MQLHLFAVWFVNYNLVKYKIMIIILKIIYEMTNTNVTSRSLNTGWSIFIEQLVNTFVKWYRKSGINSDKNLIIYTLLYHLSCLNFVLFPNIISVFQIIFIPTTCFFITKTFRTHIQLNSYMFIRSYKYVYGRFISR
jgi:hypothetical protein